MKKKLGHRKKWLLATILLTLATYGAEADVEIWSKPDKIESNPNEWIPVIGKCLTCKPVSDLEAQATNEQISKVLSPPVPNPFNLQLQQQQTSPFQFHLHKQPRLLTYNNINNNNNHAANRQSQQQQSPLQYNSPFAADKLQYYPFTPPKYYPQDLNIQPQTFYHIDSNQLAYQNQAPAPNQLAYQNQQSASSKINNGISNDYKLPQSFNIPQQIFLPQSFQIGGSYFLQPQQSKFSSQVPPKFESTGFPTIKSTAQTKIKFPDNNELIPKKLTQEKPQLNFPNIPEIQLISKKPNIPNTDLYNKKPYQNVLHNTPQADIQLLYVPVEALQRGRNTKIPSQSLSSLTQQYFSSGTNVASSPIPTTVISTSTVATTPRPYTENIPSFPNTFLQTDPSRLPPYRQEQLSLQQLNLPYRDNEYFFPDNRFLVRPPAQDVLYSVPFAVPAPFAQATTEKIAFNSQTFPQFNGFNHELSSPNYDASLRTTIGQQYTYPSTTTEKFTSNYNQLSDKNLFRTSPQQFTNTATSTATSSPFITTTTKQTVIEEESSKNKANFKPSQYDIQYSFDVQPLQTPTFGKYYQTSSSSSTSSAPISLEAQSTTQPKYRPPPQLSTQNLQKFYTYSTAADKTPIATTTQTAPTTSRQYYAQETTATAYEDPNYPTPHQPPLSVYMEKYRPNSKINDILNLLKDSKTIPVVDTIESDAAPQVFVGPSELQPPRGYAKFDLPYLSSLDSNRIERMIDHLPFFVAPLNFKPPPGYSKIPFPAPHIGSVVVSNSTTFRELTTGPAGWDESQDATTITGYTPSFSDLSTISTGASSYTPLPEYFVHTVVHTTTTPATDDISTTTTRSINNNEYRSTTEYFNKKYNNIYQRQRKPINKGSVSSSEQPVTTKQPDFQYHQNGHRFSYDYYANNNNNNDGSSSSPTLLATSTVEQEGLTNNGIDSNSNYLFDSDRNAQFQFPASYSPSLVKFDVNDGVVNITNNQFGKQEQSPTVNYNANNSTVSSSTNNADESNSANILPFYSTESSPLSVPANNDKEYPIYNRYKNSNTFNSQFYYNAAPITDQADRKFNYNTVATNPTEIDPTAQQQTINFQNVKSLTQFKPSSDGGDISNESYDRDNQSWNIPNPQFYPTRQSQSSLTDNTYASPTINGNRYDEVRDNSSTFNDVLSFSVSEIDLSSSTSSASSSTTEYYYPSYDRTSEESVSEISYAPTKSKQRNRYNKYTTASIASVPTNGSTIRATDEDSQEHRYPQKNSESEVSHKHHYDRGGIGQQSDEHFSTSTAFIDTNKYKRRRPTRPTTSTIDALTSTSTETSYSRVHRLRSKQTPTSATSVPTAAGAVSESIRSRIRRPSTVATTTDGRRLINNEQQDNNASEYYDSNFAQTAPGSNEIASSSNENYIVTPVYSDSTTAQDASSYQNEPAAKHRYYNRKEDVTSGSFTSSSRVGHRHSDDTYYVKQQQINSVDPRIGNHKPSESSSEVTDERTYPIKETDVKDENGKVDDNIDENFGGRFTSSTEDVEINNKNDSDILQQKKYKPQDEKKVVSSRRRGTWVRRVRVKKPQDVFETAESQNLASVSENSIKFDHHSKSTKIASKDDISTKSQSSTIIDDIKTTTGIGSKEDDVLGIKEDKNQQQKQDKDDYVSLHRDFTDVLTELLSGDNNHDDTSTNTNNNNNNNSISNNNNNNNSNHKQSDNSFSEAAAGVNSDEGDNEITVTTLNDKQQREEEEEEYSGTTTITTTTKQPLRSSEKINRFAVIDPTIVSEQPMTTTSEAVNVIDGDDNDVVETTTVDGSVTLASTKRKVIGTSTTTEISLETEICYRGKCVKSKKTKASDLLPVE